MKPLAIGWAVCVAIVLGAFVEMWHRDHSYPRRKERDLKRRQLNLTLADEVRWEIAQTRSSTAYAKIFHDVMLPPEQMEIRDIEVEVSGEFGVFIASQDIVKVAEVIAIHPAFRGAA